MFFHVDVNSAYLSWEANHRLKQGDKLDLRTIPSAVGGNPEKRKGIILAKSIPAKAYGIQTGEPLARAFQKCKGLVVVPANFRLYKHCSKELNKLLYNYSPKIQSFSIDESFVDVGKVKDPLALANELREDVEKSLGFTVNVGVGPNKLLAKMASNFQKPNRVHSLFPEEIPTKLWPLPVGELFMVGRKTKDKLLSMGIETIGDLASSRPELFYSTMKSHGLLIYDYAWGRETSPIQEYSFHEAKGVGNSTTLPRDIDEEEILYLYLLSLSEMVTYRLRSIDKMAYVISVHYRDHQFQRRRLQRKLPSPLDTTTDVFYQCKLLFDELWQKEPLHQIGIALTELVDNDYYQLNFLNLCQERHRRLDTTIDHLRDRFGKETILRASFLHGNIDPMIGGVGEDKDDLLLSSQL